MGVENFYFGSISNNLAFSAKVSYVNESLNPNGRGRNAVRNGPQKLDSSLSDETALLSPQNKRKEKGSGRF